MKNQSEHFPQGAEEMRKTIPEVYALLEDCALKVLRSEALNEDENVTLSSIFVEIQDLDKDIVFRLQILRNKGMITSDEALIISLALLVGRQLGISIELIRDGFYYALETQEDFTSKIAPLSIPENIKKVLIKAYSNIKDNTQA